MSSETTNILLLDIERMQHNRVGDAPTFTQAQVNAMIQLQLCYQGDSTPQNDTEYQMLQAAIKNVMTQLFTPATGGPPVLPANSSLATTTLFDDLTTVPTTGGESLATAAAGPLSVFETMGSQISQLYSDSLNPSSSFCWFINNNHQTGVPPYTADTDSNLQGDLQSYTNQIGGIENALFSSSGGPLGPNNNPNLFKAEMKALAGLLNTINTEASSDSTNGYSNGIASLFSQSLTLPGSATPTTLGTLLANLATPPSGETELQAATALQEALYGNPPAVGSGFSGTIYAYITQAQANAWGSGPG